ncbi:hypothetical protein PRNP1_013258 [Phytophthora ramorum]
MAPNLDQNTYSHDVHPASVMWSDEQQTKVWEHFLDKFATIQSRFPAPTDRFDAEGKHNMHKIVMRLIEQRAPITLVLPSFPFKSPNSIDKVLGKLPDRAEELSMERLERFCCEVEEAYPPGCKMVIFSDGRVFNDLLGVSLSDLRAFEDELVEMVKRAGHTHIYFDSMDNYVKNVEDPIPEILERFNVLHMDFNARIKTEPAIRNTYCSFCKFLERDLASQWVGMSRTAMKRSCGKIAKQMMHRNVGFSALVDDSYPDALRISIHQYNNAGPKFGIHLIPQKSGKPRTPWHSVICEDIDGTVHAMDLKDVDTSTYDLVYKHGRKWGYVERPACTPEEMAHWASIHVELVRTHMFIVARAMEGFPAPSVMDVPREAMRSLVLKYGVVTLRGFKQDDDFETATERWGDVLQWPKGTFAAGNIFDIKTERDTALPAQTLEAMSFHYDGMFKKKTPESTELGDAPVFMFFHCVESAPPEDDPKHGNTLITDTRRLLSSLPDETVERLKKISLVYRTSLFGYQDRVHTSPVVVAHPMTGELALRYHEPWGPEKTKMHPTYVTSVGYDPASNQKDEDADFVTETLQQRLYSEEFCHWHQWVKGEFVVMDNISQLHARTKLGMGGRHMRRIHFN